MHCCALRACVSLNRYYILAAVVGMMTAVFFFLCVHTSMFFWLVGFCRATDTCALEHNNIMCIHYYKCRAR